MKILHLTNHCRQSGNGIVNVAVDLACEQSRQGNILSFASEPGEYQTTLEKNGVLYYPIKQRSKNPFLIVLALWKLYRVIAKDRPSIVHAHMMSGTLFAFVLRPLFGYKIITTVHNEFQRSASLMRLGDQVIAISKAVAGSLLKRNFDANKIIVIPNGPLGSQRLPPFRTVEKTPFSKRTIITVAGLYKRKGVDDLISAFSSVHKTNENIQLVIVGDGPERGELEKLAVFSGAATNIIFSGFIADPRPLMAASDIFVLASHNEPFGLVIIEARECGCAIVGTNVGGIPEALDDGRAGKLVPAGQPKVLAEVLSSILDNDDEMKRLKECAAQNLEYFTVSRLCDDTMKAYSVAWGVS